MILSAQSLAHEAIRLLVETSVQNVVQTVAPNAVGDQIVAPPWAFLSVQRLALAAVQIFVEAPDQDASPLPSDEFLVR